MNEIKIKLTHGFEVPWDKLQYDWVAMDTGGGWWEYQKEPVYNPEGFWDVSEPRGKGRLFLMQRIDEPSKDTLIQRPSNHERAQN